MYSVEGSTRPVSYAAIELRLTPDSSEAACWLSESSSRNIFSLLSKILTTPIDLFDSETIY